MLSTSSNFQSVRFILFALLVIYLSLFETAQAASSKYRISAGGNHTCALDDTGAVCWGNNVENQIDVPNLSNPSEIAVGNKHTCAINDTGVVCWGWNDNGQTTAPALSNPTNITAGNRYTCARFYSKFSYCIF